MDKFEEKLKAEIKNREIIAEYLSFSESCHSVEEAARTAGADPKDFVKNICLIDAKGDLIVAIVKGEDRVSTTKVGKVLGIEKPRIATPEEILKLSGYPCGGTPSFGYTAKFVVDEKVLEKEAVFSGGGSQKSLVKIAVRELLKANKGIEANIRK